MNASFWSTIFGAVIGGTLAIAASYIAHSLEMNKKAKSERHEILRYLAGIKLEVNTLWRIYLENIGNSLIELEKGKPLNAYYPVTQEYFLYYTSNMNILQKVPDSKIRELIIYSYIRAKGLIDSYRLNNSFVESYER